MNMPTPFLQHYVPLVERLHADGMADWAQSLEGWLEQRMVSRYWGDLPTAQEALASLKTLHVEHPSCFVREGTVYVQASIDDGHATSSARAALQELMPWRKGPFCIQGVHIDTEWRSDMKWDRLHGALGSLQGARVLDVGCGNGYSMWRAYIEGARFVLGIDPTPRYILQYLACRHFAGHPPVWVMPAADDDLSVLSEGLFDIVLSMGVYYHRRDPIGHMRILRRHVAIGGKIIIEGLVVSEAEALSGELIPQGRYAKMRNVYSIPTVKRLCDQVCAAGFVDAQVVDVSVTTQEEQRRSPWMHYESLLDFLTPHDTTRTIEGHPAPMRAIVVAQA